MTRKQTRLDEARRALRQLGFPPKQQNERSALVLLALLDLSDSKRWSQASDPMLGITPIMNWMAHHYGKTYAPNSRETVRRQTIHQFVDAGLVVLNPDEPARPNNSGLTCYQIEPNELSLLRTYGTLDWEPMLISYLSERSTLAERYRNRREMSLVPITLMQGARIDLSPGAHSELIRDVVEQFAPRFAPGARLLYVGDTGAKFVHFDESLLHRLGVEVDPAGKMPDVVSLDEARGWLLLVEAVTSHGPVDPKRHAELHTIFAASTAGLVYVTAFPDRALFRQYAAEIAWETEVWIAENPTHLIHFNGERFLGPYA